MKLYEIMYIVWALVFIVGLVIEAVTFIQIGWAASVAAISALATNGFTHGDPMWAQILAFFATWVICWGLFFLFLGAKRNKIRDHKDGFYGFIGFRTVALKGNESGHGELAIDAKKFRFKSSQNIKENDKIIIKRISGNTMIVKKEKK